MFEQAKIAVIVPCYNESRLIGRMLRRVPHWVDVIIAVDDASQDATAEAVVASGDSRVRLMQHAANQGVGAAIRTGYQASLDAQCDVLIVMAGDDQMDPGDLPRLITPVLFATADYVKGNRFIHADALSMPLLRRLGGSALSAVTRWTSGLAIDDSQCGFTALSAAAARQLPLEQLWPRFGYPNDLLLLLAARGMRVAEVPVRPVYADEKSGLRPWHMLQIMGVIARRFWREPALRSLRAGQRAQIASYAQRLLP